MLCEFQRLIYSPNGAGFMIALYRPCERLLDGDGARVTQVKAVGYCLPVSEKLQYDLHGHWSRSARHGLQFEVEGYKEIIAPTREGIVAYLSSGQIKGVGPKLAERIFDAFGLDSLEVLDKEPSRLLSIPGISEGKLKTICDSCLANRGARDVVAFLAPHGITPNRAVRLYREYGERAMEIVRNHPYRLCELTGIGFKTADHIAMQMGLEPLSTERVDEGLLYVLADAEGRGHLCMEKHEFIKACLKLLETPQLTEEMAANRAARLLYSGKLVSYDGSVYRAAAAHAESSLAAAVKEKLRRRDLPYGDLDREIDAEESALGMQFAPEQRNAVKMALTKGLSIITGGPGTGKTQIQRALLNIYRRKHPEKKICCCAPTGRAARRMEQATGFPASTVHRALGLLAGEDGSFGEPAALEAGLVLVDEASMLDVYLAGYLFGAVKAETQVVLVGDADQLPSVGPGAVLSELIASGCVPVVRLDRVFRQDAGSRIAANAKRIRHGEGRLDYGEDFQFIDSPDIAESADRLVALYLREAARYGVDSVALLTPYRQKTETGVNALNERLRDKVNPPGPHKPEAVHRNRKFRCGDKVMQVKNRDDVSNGDIGYIRKITCGGDDIAVHVDFGDGRIKEYDAGELDMLDLGYASTVHKSQGSEYQSVIVNLQRAHSIMLTRPLLYTAITRARNRIVIVGERRALYTAVNRTDAEKRGTCLAKRLQESDEKTGE